MFKEVISNKSKSEILALGFRRSIKSTSTCSIMEKVVTKSSVKLTLPTGRLA